MFTGLIEEVGRVISVQTIGDGTKLQVAAPIIAPDIRNGESVAVNGCCLTVTASTEDLLTFDLLRETIMRSNLGRLSPDSRVNLERAIAADGRMGGHFVQGHVDCTARVLSLENRGSDLRLEVELPTSFALYVADKGSIAVNGVSLTIAGYSTGSFSVWLIPHTRQHTNMDDLQEGALVNLEFDMLAKYLERLLQGSASGRR